MTVVSVGPWQPRTNSIQTFLANGAHPEIAGYYDVTIIDSCDSYHGPTDTRTAKPGGIGQGVARFYVDASLGFIGYTWSTGNASEYESAAGNGYMAAFGRWIP